MLYHQYCFSLCCWFCFFIIFCVFCLSLWFICTVHVLLLLLFSEELNDSLNEDVPGETKEPASCNATEHKETELDRASSSSSGE